MAHHLEIAELEQGGGLEICGKNNNGSVFCSPVGPEGRPTHILTANFGTRFLQAILDVFSLVALVVPQTPDEVIQRFFEPADLF